MAKQTLEFDKPALIGIVLNVRTLELEFDPGIAYGDGTDLEAWNIEDSISKRSPGLVTVVDSKIHLRFAIPPVAPYVLRFFGPQPIFRAKNTAILETFSVGVL